MRVRVGDRVIRMTPDGNRWPGTYVVAAVDPLAGSPPRASVTMTQDAVAAFTKIGRAFPGGWVDIRGLRPAMAETLVDLAHACEEVALAGDLDAIDDEHIAALERALQAVRADRRKRVKKARATARGRR